MSKLLILKCEQKTELNVWALLKWQELLILSSTKSHWHFSGPDLVDYSNMKNQKRTWWKLQSGMSNRAELWAQMEHRIVGGIWEVVLEAQLEAGVEPGVQLGICTPNCRGEEERVMPNKQPLLRLYPIEDDTLCLHCSFLPYSSPPKKDIPDKRGIWALETGKSHCQASLAVVE